MSTDILTDDEKSIIEMGIAKKMLPLMERAEKYLLAHPDITSVTTDCGKFFILHTKDKYIRFGIIIKNNNEPMPHYAAFISFESVNSENVYWNGFFGYSPLNHGFCLNYIKEYKLNEELKHDEAEYFQKSTLRKIPPEECYIAAEELLESLWEGQYVHIAINCYNILDDMHHVHEYEKLVQKLESINE